MLPRILFKTRSLCKLGRRCMADYAPTLKEPHMNDIPLPQKFEEVYQKRQVGNNAVLIGGLAFLSMTLFIVIKSEVLFFNAMPPKKNPE